jgi:hypothetical protein
MKHLARIVVASALLLLPLASVKAQQSTYALHSVLTPGTVISGHVFGSETVIGTAVISDNGIVAFVVNWPDHEKVISAVYTLQRRVVGSGDVIDGHPIALIAPTAQLAINTLGVVAYSASYGGGDTEGIFTEKRPAFDLKTNSVPTGTPFTLSDKGAVTIGAAANHVVCSATSTLPQQSQPKTSLWGRIATHVAIPMPRGGVVVDGGGSTPPSGSPAPKPNPQQSAQVCAESPLTMLSSNKQGQIVIPINTSTGPYLLIGTPITH